MWTFSEQFTVSYILFYLTVEIRYVCSYYNSHNYLLASIYLSSAAKTPRVDIGTPLRDLNVILVCIL